MHAGNSSLFHIFFYIFLSQAKLYILLVILCFRNFSRVNNYLLPKFEQIHSKKLIKIVIVLIAKYECPKRILNDRKMEEKKFVEEIKSHRLQWKISHNCTEVTLPPPLFLSIHLSSPINLPIWNRLKKDGEGKKRREREGEGKKKSSIKSTLLKGKSEGKEGKKNNGEGMKNNRWKVVFLEIEAPLGIRNPVEKCRWARRFPRIIIGNKKGSPPPALHTLNIFK